MIQAVIIDQHPIVREALALMLRVIPNVNVVGSVGYISDAYPVCRDLQPELIIVDLYMPSPEIMMTLKQLRVINPSSTIIAFTGIGWDHEKRTWAYEAGANYLVNKLSPATNLENIIVNLRSGDKTTYQSSVC